MGNFIIEDGQQKFAGYSVVTTLEESGSRRMYCLIPKTHPHLCFMWNQENKGFEQTYTNVEDDNKLSAFLKSQGKYMVQNDMEQNTGGLEKKSDRDQTGRGDEPAEQTDLARDLALALKKLKHQTLSNNYTQKDNMPAGTSNQGNQEFLKEGLRRHQQANFPDSEDVEDAGEIKDVDDVLQTKSDSRHTITVLNSQSSQDSNAQAKSLPQVVSEQQHQETSLQPSRIVETPVPAARRKSGTTAGQQVESKRTSVRGAGQPQGNVNAQIPSPPAASSQQQVTPPPAVQTNQTQSAGMSGTKIQSPGLENQGQILLEKKEITTEAQKTAGFKVPPAMLADAHAVYGLNERKGFQEVTQLPNTVGEVDKFVRLGMLANRLVVDMEDQSRIDPKYGKTAEEKQKLREKQTFYKRNSHEIGILAEDLSALDGHKLGNGRSTTKNIMAVINSTKNQEEKKKFLVNAIAGFAIADPKLIRNYDKVDSNNAFVKDGNANLKYVENLCAELYKVCGGNREEYEKSFANLNVKSITDGLTVGVTASNTAKFEANRLGIVESEKTSQHLQNMVEELAKREFTKNDQRMLIEDYKKNPSNIALKLTPWIENRIEKGDYDAIGNLLNALKVEIKDKKNDHVTNINDESYKNVRDALLSNYDKKDNVDKFKFAHSLMEFNYIGAEDRVNFRRRHNVAINAIMQQSSEKVTLEAKDHDSIKAYIKEMVYATPKVNQGDNSKDQSVEVTVKFLKSLQDKGLGNLVKASLNEINRADLLVKTGVDKENSVASDIKASLLFAASYGNKNEFTSLLESITIAQPIDIHKYKDDAEKDKDKEFYKQLALAGGSYLADFNKRVKSVGGTEASKILTQMSKELLQEHEKGRLRDTPTYLPQTAIHELEKAKDTVQLAVGMKTKAKAAARSALQVMGASEKQSFADREKDSRGRGEIRDAGYDKLDRKGKVDADLNPPTIGKTQKSPQFKRSDRSIQI